MLQGFTPTECNSDSSSSLSSEALIHPTARRRLFFTPPVSDPEWMENPAESMPDLATNATAALPQLHLSIPEADHALRILLVTNTTLAETRAQKNALVAQRMAELHLPAATLERIVRQVIPRPNPAAFVARARKILRQQQHQQPPGAPHPPQRHTQKSRTLDDLSWDDQ